MDKEHIKGPDRRHCEELPRISAQTVLLHPTGTQTVRNPGPARVAI